MGFDVERFSAVRQKLEDAGIPHQHKIQGATGDERRMTGLRLNTGVIYYIYVHSRDYDAARACLAQLKN